MSESGFKILEDGSCIADKIKLGGKVLVNGADEPSNTGTFLSNCLTQLEDNEKKYADATEKMAMVKEATQGIIPRLDYDLSYISGSSYMNLFVESSSWWDMFGATPEYFVAKGANTQLYQCFIHGGEIDDEAIPFWHPSAEWHTSELGFDKFQDFSTEEYVFQCEETNSFDDEKPYCNLYRQYELTPTNGIKRCYYSLEINKESVPDYEYSSERVFKKLEPQNSKVVILIASKKKISFCLPVTVKEENWMADDSIYKVIPRIGKVAYTFDEDNYYYRVELTPAWRATVYLENKYCQHSIYYRYILLFKFETEVDEPFSINIIHSPVIWTGPINHYSYPLKNQISTTSLNGESAKKNVCIEWYKCIIAI